LSQIEPERLRCLRDHPGLRLATGARDGIGADVCRRMMRAIIDPIEPDAMRLEALPHPDHELVKVTFRVEASGNAGLVRDDHDAKSALLKDAAGGKNAVDEFNLSGPVKVARIAVDDAVTVQDQSRSHSPAHRRRENRAFMAGHCIAA
jgi:hypothetical protein